MEFLMVNLIENLLFSCYELSGEKISRKGKFY